jgi:hypothetical protein
LTSDDRFRETAKKTEIIGKRSINPICSSAF